MTQLTKEHFDSELKKLVTKNEFSGQLKAVDDRLQSMDGQFKSMERRFDSVEAKLGEQTRQLKPIQTLRYKTSARRCRKVLPAWMRN